MKRFRAEGGIWTPLKKHKILGHPENDPKAALGRPKGPKDAQKDVFEVFWIPFGGPVPTVQSVFPPRREPHFRGSRVPQNSTFFFRIFWSSAKRASRESLLEDFLRFGQIFEDFWVSLGLPLRPQAGQVHAQNHFSKKVDFLEARWRNPGTPG